MLFIVGVIDSCAKFIVAAAGHSGLTAQNKQQLAQSMFFSNYSEFLEPEVEIIAFSNSANDHNYHNRPAYLSPPVLASQHDLVYSQFTETIFRRLTTLPYPSNFVNFNPFCPLCLGFVYQSAPYTTCFINSERNYLIHRECLQKDKTYELRNIGELLENKTKVEEIGVEIKNRFDMGLDSRVFYLDLAITHPINDRSFIKLNKKVSLARDHFSISLDEKDENSLFPNILMLPLTDFHITVNIYELSNRNNRTKHASYVSLRGIKEKKKVLIRCEQLAMEVEIVDSMEEKRRLTDKMNYKYRYPLDLAMPVLRILRFKINLPEEFQESEEEEFIVGSRSTIVEQLLNQKESPSISTIKTSEHATKKHKFSITDSSSSHEPAIQAQIVNFSKLISTNTLNEYVKNATQSRLFQDYLALCPLEQIQIVIENIKPYLRELIMHEYGNYMIQKLIEKSNALQRLEILQQILPDLPELIQNKHGTHTIQLFINYFTLSEEFTLVAMQIRENYYELCRNNNSTHFIQKIIKNFPIQYTIPFFHFTTENLLAFALDKNAMCVIKHMIRRLRQLQNIEGPHSQVIEAIRRQLIINVTFSVDRLIMDSYGNYVIQFCYELFDLEKCSGITERILSRFTHYAVGKFASNVLLKCISNYWTDRRIYSSLKCISNGQIVEIFRNKDGNKILLQIMEKLEGTDLWDRLYSILIQVEPTRFYHDRWGVCLGSRSGQVGTKLSGFPQAKKKHYTRKG